MNLQKDAPSNLTAARALAAQKEAKRQGDRNKERDNGSFQLQENKLNSQFKNKAT